MISFNNDRNGGGFYPSEIAKANTAMFSFAQPRSRHRHGLNGIGLGIIDSEVRNVIH